jgi:hypothetical protein
MCRFSLIFTGGVKGTKVPPFKRMVNGKSRPPPCLAFAGSHVTCRRRCCASPLLSKMAGSADSERRRRAIFNARSGTHLHTQIAALKTKWNEIKVEAMIDD